MKALGGSTEISLALIVVSVETLGTAEAVIYATDRKGLLARAATFVIGTLATDVIKWAISDIESQPFNCLSSSARDCTRDNISCEHPALHFAGLEPPSHAEHCCRDRKMNSADHFPYRSAKTTHAKRLKAL